MIRTRLLAGPAAAALLIPVLAGPPAVPQAGPAGVIRHVVVLMQENHTFDNELGYWCDQDPACAATGSGIPSSVRLADGTVVTPSAAPDIWPIIGHSVAAQVTAIDGGKMDRWGSVPGCDASTGFACISYYRPSAVPNLAGLASSGAVEARAFTLHTAPSWSGHLDLFAATTDGFAGNNPFCPAGQACHPGWGVDSHKVSDWAAGGTQPACIPDPALGLANGGCYAATQAAYAPTIMDRLDAAGQSWRIYAAPPSEAGGFSTGYQWSGCPYFVECLDTPQSAGLVDAGRFFTDAAAGTLPAVSFVISAGTQAGFSQHNGDSNAAGDNWIGKVAAAVMNSPDWPSTALIIAYDDCGCAYDHVPPPAGPDGQQMGPRVPFIIVSPYAKPGFTDTASTSSTGSILRFIEETFSLPPLQPNGNDGQAYDLAGAFSFGAAPRLSHPAMTWRKLPAPDYRVSRADRLDGT